MSELGASLDEMCSASHGIIDVIEKETSKAHEPRKRKRTREIEGAPGRGAECLVQRAGRPERRPQRPVPRTNHRGQPLTRKLGTPLRIRRDSASIVSPEHFFCALRACCLWWIGNSFCYQRRHYVLIGLIPTAETGTCRHLECDYVRLL